MIYLIKNKFNLIFVLLFFQCYSQNDSFFDSIQKINLPITIDQITFNNLDHLKKRTYENLKPYLYNKNKDLGIKFENDLENINFYIYGKFMIKNKTAVIFISDSPLYKSTDSWLLIYSENNELINMTYIGNKWIYNNNMDLIYSYSIINNDHFKRYDEFQGDITYGKFRVINEDFKLEMDDCHDNIECLSYKQTFDSIPERNLNNYDFNITFFENNSHLVPFKDCSPFDTRIIENIEGYNAISFKNYFIDSKKIANQNKIIFFLNVSEFDKYKTVKEIGYLLLNSDGKLIKTDVIAKHKIDNKGKNVASSSKVYLYNDYIQIESISENKITTKYRVE